MNCPCTVQNLTELYFCTEPNCMQPSLRCKDCFKLSHKTETKKTHSYENFCESPLYKNFIYLIKILEIVKAKVQRNFSSLKDSTDYISDLIFSSMESVQKDVFNNNEGYSYSQFYVLKQLYYGRKAQFNVSPTSQLVYVLTKFSIKKFEEIKQTLIKNTPEQALLEFSFNQITQNTTQAMETFIIEEQTAFIDYCEKLKQDGKDNFDIFDYMSYRRKMQNKKQTYYSRMFQNFLQDKYLEAPEKEDIFTLSEYTRYIWKQFHIITTMANEEEYLNHWMEAYQVFSNYYKQAKLQQSEFSFRMWKEYAAKAPNKKSLKNIYFLDSFILSFIDITIQKKLYGTQFDDYSVESWKSYRNYLKDYVKVVEDRQQEYVVMTDYKKYFIFRSQCQKFIGHIRQSKQVVYDSKIAVEYLNELFIKNGKVSLKNYKNFLQKKQEEEDMREKQTEEQIEALKQQLINQIGKEKFYETLFIGFVNSIEKNNTPITKQSYYIFRQQVLDKIDQNQIQIENQHLEELKQLSRRNQQGMKSEEMVDPNNQKIKYEIEDDEELIHEINAEESSEGEGITPEICLCCNGNPDDCQQQQCQMMGYCITCSL